VIVNPDTQATTPSACRAADYRAGGGVALLRRHAVARA